jgi:hypothetical protein
VRREQVRRLAQACAMDRETFGAPHSCGRNARPPRHVEDSWPAQGCTCLPSEGASTRLRASVPLTLALSLGEREQVGGSGEYSASGELVSARYERSPLPKGEGRGEGEGSPNGIDPAEDGVSARFGRSLSLPSWTRIRAVARCSQDKPDLIIFCPASLSLLTSAPTKEGFMVLCIGGLG